MLRRGSHRNSFIGRGTYSSSSTDNMKIGRYCSIGSGMYVASRRHPLTTISTWPGLYNADSKWNGIRLNDTIEFNENLTVNNGYICEIGMMYG